MLRRLAPLLLVFQSLWMPTRALSSAPPSDLGVKLSKRVSNYNLGVFSFVGALIQVSTDFQIPMGIVWVDTPESRAQTSFAWKDATILEIIQDIAKTDTGYQVQARNGVVHISRISTVPDRENFLKLKIEMFQTHNTALEVASYQLHTIITPIKGNHQISIAGPGDSQLSLDLKNCTVEDVLDAFAVGSRGKIWMVVFPNRPTAIADGILRTRSLFTDDPIRDDQQPVWYLHRWGDPAPPLVSGAPAPR